MYFNYDYVLTNHSNKNFGAKRSSTKYIIIHYTGNAKDTAENNAKYFFNGDRRAGANYFVDGKGVWASTPEAYTAYGAGVLHNRKYAKLWGVCTNHNSINIEIACDAGNSLPTAEAVTNTVELTKSLMAKYGIPEDHVVRHKDVCGKNCPAYWWDDGKWQSEFKARLSGNATASIPQQSMPKTDNQPKHVNHVDGVWGEATTRALQKYLGTVIDGIISHQLVSSEELLISRFGHTFRFDNTRKGSLCIKALQKKLGVTVDGLIGKNTIKALQRWLGVPADGICGKQTTIALQKFLESKGMFQ
ncbi:peptidoglycan-binding domain-containing protein [Sharpea azabuensis]|uniref:N-acetylmuramoyl-L-alanine amidase n=1 Tax=Sharpea azabuensis TaxID=322505 RepID=A0A1H6XM39_9FIRM|nr:peptidoglycan-binding domain-containing protein [Sharpea azabuensis]SEJ25962.1 N-acetylmuramoyl-L-alanine amidase [Sharpea azabuensis]